MDAGQTVQKTPQQDVVENKRLLDGVISFSGGLFVGFLGNVDFTETPTQVAPDVQYEMGVPTMLPVPLEAALARIIHEPPPRWSF